MLYLLYNVVVVVENTLQGTDTVAASEGSLDLSDIDLGNALPQRLTGSWAFYPEQFVDVENAPSDAPASIFVPDSWNYQGYTAESFGTYRLQVILDTPYDNLALYLPIIGTAYRLYVNSKLVDEVGNAAARAEAFQAAYGPKMVLLKGQSTQQLDVTLHVANYGFAWGGLWKPPVLGTAESIMQAQLSKTIRSVSIAAIFFTIALLNLLHFSLHPKEISPFLLSLACLCFGLREADTSEILYTSNLIPFDFALAVRINFLTFYLALPVFVAYFHRIFPHEFSRLVVKVIYAVSGLFVVTTMATPPSWFSHYMPVFQFFTLLCIPYLLYVVSLAAYRKRTGARLIAIGGFVLSALIINDILFALGAISSGHMASLGLLAFTVCQNYLTYIRFSRAQEENLHLSMTANQDSLTALLNRRGLMLQVKLLESANARYSLMILDFDYFKQLNDELGHDAGDTVLTLSGEIILTSLRKRDLAARWGGEEFVILLPDACLDDAHKIAKKLRDKLNHTLSSHMSHPVSASFGVAERKPDESYSCCLKRADQALYSAKEQGRNLVCLAD